MLFDTAMLNYKTMFRKGFLRERVVSCYTVQYFIFLTIMPIKEVFTALNQAIFSF